MKNSLSRSLIELVKKHFLGIPPYIFRNRVTDDESKLSLIKKSLYRHYYGLPENTGPLSRAHEEDLANNLIRRLDSHRSVVIPWLDHVRPLRGARILEIGCGTGSSTVALAEQGARLTAIDINEGGLNTARERCAIYGLDADFRIMTATKIRDAFPSEEFDYIIFFASLEHMPVPDRLASLRAAWDMLKPGALLAVIETPNRLWYHDSHSAMLPFFHWLPDDLAYQYTRFSAREWFNKLLENDGPESMAKFIVEGRAASFHEFDLAIKPANNLHVASSLSGYRNHMFRRFYYRSRETSLDKEYKSLLKKIRPEIHDGFYDEFLNLIIMKD